MPCFKGLAISIHADDGPIAEHAIQKNMRASRISSYIPVPPAKVPVNSTTGKPAQSTFSISITLLTPGLNVPYSTPKPTEDDPYPRPRVVGGLASTTNERGKYSAAIPAYIPRTKNPNETIAAYIYFDGRVKEEVATLLRRGEETWVNSRWVSVPESEGGGLAERDFLFREVGLERWLNGLDLQGSSKEKQERIEKRQRRLEQKRRKRREQEIDSDDEDESSGVNRRGRNGVLRYGGEPGSPVEDLADDDSLFSSGSDSDDDPPEPEAAGQIKVALFRVLASGEIKRGEYSPQFDAHDDDEGGDQNGASNGDDGDADIDHTTSFAKPKALDPKSISTQTVTGLDPPDSPYAVFTFLYRGEKQLQKMKIIPYPDAQKAPKSGRRKQSGPDFSNLGPLKTTGTVGYSGYRDSANKRKSKARDADAMDSDADDDEDDKAEDGDNDVDAKNENGNLLSPEDARRQGEIADGVQKIKLKRQHSAEPLAEAAATRKSPYIKSEESPSVGTPHSANSTSGVAGTPPDRASSPSGDQGTESIIGSPFKRHRASVPGLENNLFGPLGPATTETVTQSPAPSSEPSKKEEQPTAETKMDSDEDLFVVTKKRKLYGCAIPPKRMRRSANSPSTRPMGWELLRHNNGESSGSDTSTSFKSKRKWEKSAKLPSTAFHGSTGSPPSAHDSFVMSP